VVVAAAIRLAAAALCSTVWILQVRLATALTHSRIGRRALWAVAGTASTSCLTLCRPTQACGPIHPLWHARTHACARTLCPPARAVGMGKIIIVCSYVPGIVDSGSSCLVLPDTMLQVSPCPHRIRIPFGDWPADRQT
jgi:hypothetical protein